MEVLCEGKEMHKLSKTYLPLSELKECCARFMEEGENFPFLKLEVSLSQANRNKWKFLHDAFYVRLREDITMYLTVLDQITLENHDFAGFKRMDRVFDLYQVLHAKCLELGSAERETEIKRIRYVKLLEWSSPKTGQFSNLICRKFFEDECGILLPNGDTDSFPWSFTSRCRWDAPPDMQTKHPLGSLYSIHLRESETSKSAITQFFRDTIGVLDCTWADFIIELKTLKQIKCTDFDRIKGLYSRLDRMKTKAVASERAELKCAFFLY
jgi:hypothetical protein